jgi:DNA-binding transcriptional ArsR family regulator
MAQKIGDALKRAIAQERAVGDVEKSRKGEESLLLNPTRIEIFQYLCKNPCSKLRAIAKALELAVPTAEWHLRKLTEKGLITAKNVGKYKIYYPAEMIDRKDVELLSLLSGDKAKLICGAVASDPGITQGKLGKKVGMYQQEVGWYTSQLTEKGVLSCVRDGRFKRYYISEDMGKVLRSDRKRRNLFKKTLIKALKVDGANPEIMRSRGDTLVIQIGGGKEKTILKVNLNLIPRFLQGKEENFQKSILT